MDLISDYGYAVSPFKKALPCMKSIEMFQGHLDTLSNCSERAQDSKQNGEKVERKSCAPKVR